MTMLTTFHDCAKGHADANFAGAARHVVGRHAI
jgi:hypothetical protein